MLRWSIGFFILALVAALFGFGGIASGLVGIAKILFFLFIVGFVLTLLSHLFSGSSASNH